jgi:hypothetical protein
VQDFLKLCVIVLQLLTTRIALDSRDFLVWLALSGVPRVVPLDLVEVAVAVPACRCCALGSGRSPHSPGRPTVPSYHVAPRQ